HRQDGGRGEQTVPKTTLVVEIHFVADDLEVFVPIPFVSEFTPYERFVVPAIVPAYSLGYTARAFVNVHLIEVELVYVVHPSYFAVGDTGGDDVVVRVDALQVGRHLTMPVSDGIMRDNDRVLL